MPRALVLPAVSHDLELRDAELADPGAGQVRVRMQAAAINPSDRMFLTGRYGIKPQPPCVPGFEGVGIVEACGPGMLPRLLKDRRVAVAAERGGTWQSHLLMPADRLVPLPASIPLEHAATFFVNPATAWVMTREVLAVPRGEWLLVTAAASALGRMICRLGRIEGFRVCAVVRHERQRQELLDAGAAAVVVFDAASDDPSQLAEAIAGHGPIKYGVDPVGGALTSAVIDALGEQSRLLVYGSLSEERFTVDPRQLLFKRQTVEGFALGDWMRDRSLAAKLRLFWRLRSLVANGTLATGRTRRFGPEEFAAALDPNTTASGEKGLFVWDDAPDR